MEKCQGVVVTVNEQPYYAELTMDELQTLIGEECDKAFIDIKDKSYDVLMPSEGVARELSYNRGYYGDYFVIMPAEEDTVHFMTEEDVNIICDYYNTFSRETRYSYQEMELFRFLCNTNKVGRYSEGDINVTISFDEFMMVVDNHIDRAREGILQLFSLLFELNRLDELENRYQDFLNDVASAV